MFSAGAPHVLPVDQRLEDAYSLNWTSEPLASPIEILGYPQAVLYVAVTADIATSVVRLMDVAPDGTAALVTKGVLNLTHRESHEDPSPVVPGQVYEIVVPLDATSWQFEAGHRIRIGISGADFPNTWPSPKPYTADVHFGGEFCHRRNSAHRRPLSQPLMRRLIAQAGELPVTT
jgi:putative CocE/NonD family hydrolase